jgi:hypothetical protein
MGRDEAVRVKDERRGIRYLHLYNVLVGSNDTGNYYHMIAAARTPGDEKAVRLTAAVYPSPAHPT